MNKGLLIILLFLPRDIWNNIKMKLLNDDAIKVILSKLKFYMLIFKVSLTNNILRKANSLKLSRSQNIRKIKA